MSASKRNQSINHSSCVESQAPFPRRTQEKMFQAKNRPSYKKQLPSGLVHPALITKEPFFPLPVTAIVLPCSHNLLFSSTWGLAYTDPQTVQGINVTMRSWREGLPCQRKEETRGENQHWITECFLRNLIHVLFACRRMYLFVCLHLQRACLRACGRLCLSINGSAEIPSVWHRSPVICQKTAGHLPPSWEVRGTCPLCPQRLLRPCVYNLASYVYIFRA